MPWKEEPGGLQSMGSQSLGQTERLTLLLSLSIILKFWYFKITENWKAILMLSFSGEEV